MKRCTRCIMTETWDGISFDEEGVCNLCRVAERKVKIDWAERQRWLKAILQKYKEYAKSRGNKYNCIVGFSGGKDSSYQLWAAKVKYGMRPLAVTFDHGFPMTPEGEWNLMEIPKRLDCDHLRFTIGNGLRNGLCRKGSEANGDFCWHCHNGVGAIHAWVSKLWDIPLQIWGEPTAEYQTYGLYKFEDMEEATKEHFEKFWQYGPKQKDVLPPGYEMVDLQPFTWPEGEFEVKGVYLGNYEPWNQLEQVEIITRELGWRHRETDIGLGTYVDWDKVDCPAEPARDWQKFIKRGFARTTFQASKDIRSGLISREEALRLEAQYDGKRPKSLDDFLKEIEMTEEEFNQLTRRHIVPRSE